MNKPCIVRVKVMINREWHAAEVSATLLKIVSLVDDNEGYAHGVVMYGNGRLDEVYVKDIKILQDMPVINNTYESHL